MSFSETDLTRRTWNGNFLKQIDVLIDWNLDKGSDTGALCTGIGCSRASGLFGITAVRNLEHKQHTVVDDNGLVLAVETIAANYHDSKPLLYLLDKANIQPETSRYAEITRY